MKKLLATAICSLPFALAPAVYAQATTGGGAATGAPASTSASASPDGSGASAPRTDGASMTPSTNATTQAQGTTGTAADRTGMTSSASDWSVKSDMIGESVYNENDEKIGDIRDVLASHDGKLTSFIVGAGGFLGMGEHNVAIPFDRITKSGDKLMLAGYTKEQLKELPKYEPRRSDRLGTTSTDGTTDTRVSPAAPATGGAPATTPPPATSTTR